MEGILFLACIGLAFWIWRLSQRIDALEEHHQPSKKTLKFGLKTEEDSAADQQTSDESDRSKWPEHLKNKAKTINRTQSKSTKPPFELESFLGQKLFPILGTTSIILAIGFFTLWAFSNGWVGPMGRIAIGILFSVALLGLGEYLRPKYPQFFQYITAAGVAGLIITTSIAQHFYGFIEALPSLALYTLEAGTGVFLSLRYNSRILGNFAVLGGLLAPVLAGPENFALMGLLSFLALVCVGAFTLATQKRWPEIQAIVLLATTSFLGYAVGQVIDGAGVMNPITLLAFIFGLYALAGAGGVVRLLTQPHDQASDDRQLYEIILFSIALLLSNSMAFGVFDHLEWNHYGFVVGAQALGLYALAQWFAQRGQSRFHLVGLACSLLFIVLATLWETQDLSEIIIALILIAEGAMMCWIGQSTQQRLFEIAGKIVLTISGIFVIDIDGMWLSALAIVALAAALAFSIGKIKQPSQQWWLIASLLFVSAIFIHWNFEYLEPIFDHHNLAALAWILPLSWFTAITYSTNLIPLKALRYFGAIGLAFMNLLALGALQEYNLLNGSLFFGLLMVANFASLAAFFTDTSPEASYKEKNIAVITTLALSILLIVTYGGTHLEEPVRTLFWLAFAGTFTGIGLSQNWSRFRYAGLGLFIFVIAKLYLIDVWGFDEWVRFVAFFALGAVLLGVGFFYQKLWTKK